MKKYVVSIDDECCCAEVEIFVNEGEFDEFLKEYRSFIGKDDAVLEDALRDLAWLIFTDRGTCAGDFFEAFGRLYNRSPIYEKTLEHSSVFEYNLVQTLELDEDNFIVKEG